jgi:hypothetical protein
MKKTPLMTVLLGSVLMLPAVSFSAEKDPYISGFENFAKENPELAGDMKTYIKDIQKAMTEKPELKPVTTNESH